MSIGKNGVVQAPIFYENSSGSAYTVVGSLTNNNGVLSGFSASNYIQTSTIDLSTANNWDIIYKLKYSQLNGYQVPFSSDYSVMLGFNNNKVYYGLGQGSSWNIVSLHTYNNYTFEDNIDYFFKISFTGTSYSLSYSLDGNTYILAITDNSTNKVASVSSYRFGDGRVLGTPFKGSLDLPSIFFRVENKVVWSGLDAYLQNDRAKIGKNFIASKSFYEI
jgi:hypothetical protein